jgi:transcriptional regulator with XRE-family HTH domain
MEIAEQMQYVVSQIKRIRMQKGVSQIELSLRADLSQSFLANLEKGKKLPSVMTIIKIADALEADPKDFFSEELHAESRQQIKNRIINLLGHL